MKSPQTLDDLDAHAVAPLGTLDPARLRAWAQAVEHRWVEADLGNLRTRKAALQAIGRGFGFPQWYGANLDALYDCLTDLPDTAPAPGYVVLLRGFGDKAPREGLSADDRNEILDVFRDAAAALSSAAAGAAQMPLRVFTAD